MGVAAGFSLFSAVLDKSIQPVDNDSHFPPASNASAVTNSLVGVVLIITWILAFIATINVVLWSVASCKTGKQRYKWIMILGYIQLVTNIISCISAGSIPDVFGLGIAIWAVIVGHQFACGEQQYK